MEEQRALLCCKSVVDVNIGSADTVSYGFVTSLVGEADLCGFCVPPVSVLNCQFPLSSIQERCLFLVDDGGKRGRDCISVPATVELWTAMCDSWRPCCQATDFAGVIW